MKEETGHYKISDYSKAGKEWKRFFPDTPFREMWDNLLTVLFGEIVIDIVKFDKRLESLYPEEWENHSMEEIVTAHYGEKARGVLKRFI